MGPSTRSYDLSMTTFRSFDVGSRLRHGRFCASQCGAKVLGPLWATRHGFKVRIWPLSSHSVWSQDSSLQMDEDPPDLGAV
ncbi:hypothetical protein Nepgr_021983 [Nepenthes gracilis]|uniref:Uncharacterized protein n=1 Tax=Nepenthes gracilis TaxID=150966 RepID=A0AAD3XWE1_NEPGR|nr:hypothetical protein Nepgr_021983 [Nepenthes gracilis]